MKNLNFGILILFLFYSKTIIAQDENQVNTRQIVTEDELIHIISYKKIISKNYYGWKLNYTEIKDISDDLILPLDFSFTNYRLKPTTLSSNKIKSYDHFTLGLGLNGYIQLLNGIFIGMGMNTPIGYERFQRENYDRKNTRFLVGIQTKQGVFIVPWKNFGITLGADFNQHFTNSAIINREINFEIIIGINF